MSNKSTASSPLGILLTWLVHLWEFQTCMITHGRIWSIGGWHHMWYVCPTTPKDTAQKFTWGKHMSLKNLILAEWSYVLNSRAGFSTHQQDVAVRYHLSSSCIQGGSTWERGWHYNILKDLLILLEKQFLEMETNVKDFIIMIKKRAYNDGL